MIFSDDPQTSQVELTELAEVLRQYRDETVLPSEVAAAVELLRANEHGFHYHRRARAFASRRCYVADVFLPKVFLRGGYVSDLSLRCIAQPGDVGGIELLPFRNELGPDVTWERSWVTWNNGAILRMAEGLADAANYADLPVLGDALEEAGCNNPQILQHCRAGAPHEHDCWVVEGLLSLPAEPG